MADLQISIDLKNLDRVRDALNRLSGKQAQQAYANALNDTAFKARKAMQTEITGAFDRPTPFITKAPKVFKATAEDLTVSIRPTMDTRKQWSPGGKVGVDPQDVLQAQEFGGSRRDKRSEAALRRANLLPAGYQTAIPKIPYPGSDDGRGNLNGRFLQRLLSYLQAYSEQGHKANMSEKKKKKLRNQQGIGYTATKKVYKTTLGVRYFVTLGRLRGGNRASHLEPGIWAASGLHDVDIKPVLLFVRHGTYKPRISMDRIAKDADLQTYLDRRVRARVRNLAEGKSA